MSEAALQIEDENTAVSAGGQLGKRLSAFDTAGGQAYSWPEDDNCYALLHDPLRPLRRHVVDALPRIRPCALASVIEHRIINHGGAERLITLIQRPQGPSLASLAKAKGLPERTIREDILPHLVLTLRALHDAGLTHRALNPERLFYEAPEMGELYVGECFSAPAGFEQPFIYEPIERSMAQSVGRGEGFPADDYYALGVTLLALASGKDLTQGRTAEQILLSKMTHGSFWALSQGADLVGGLAILIRGLLHDNPNERWNAQHIALWMDGTSRTVSPAGNEWTFARPVSFLDKPYTDRRLLAAAMARDVGNAFAFIKKQELQSWVSQYLPNLPTSPELERLVLQGQGGRRTDHGGVGPDYVVARFCTMLDPMGPVRFRELALMPDGLGPAMAMAQTANEEVKAIMTEMVTGPLLPAIADILATVYPEGKRSHLVNALTSLAKLVRRKSLADAPERALYALNPGLCCQSPIFSGRWVQDVETAIVILNDIADHHGDRLNLVEHHLTGFLAAHNSTAADLLTAKPALRSDHLGSINSLLLVLGELQQNLGLPKLKPLTSYFSKRILPAIRKLRSATLRQKAEQRLDKIVELGDLKLMAENFDLERLAARDEHNFHRAKMRVASIDRRLAQLDKNITPRHFEAILQGGKGGGILATAVLLLSLLARLL